MQFTPLLNPYKRWIYDAAACTVIVLVGAVALWQYLGEAKTLYWGDIELYFAPMQQFLRINLDQGKIPLWNPYILCGQPYVGNPQTWLLYPTTIFAKWISPWTFLTVTAALHLILGGLFFYFLARDNRRSRISSILAGIVFMLGGYFASKMQFPNMTQAIAYAPLVLLLAGRLAKSPSIQSALPLGFAFGLQLLAAHAQASVMTLYLAAAYAIYRGLAQLRLRRQHWRAFIGWSVAAAVFAACLDAGQLLPVTELWRHSDRQTLTLSVANRFILQPDQLTNFFRPNRFGSPFYGDFQHSGNFWETACYLGGVPCLLALPAAAQSVRRSVSDGSFWTLIFGLSIWLALGRTGGLYDLAFYLAPGVRAFHDPARMLLGAAIAGPMLAATGLDYLLPLATGVRLRFAMGCAAILLTAADMGLFVQHLYPLAPVGAIEGAVRADAGDSARLALPGHRVMFKPDERSTWHYFVDYSNFRINDRTYFQSLLATHTPNMGMLTGSADAGGYEPEPVRGAVKRYADAFKLHALGDDTGLEALDVDSVISFQDKPRAAPESSFGIGNRVVWTRQSTAGVPAAMLGSGAYSPVARVGVDQIVIAIPAKDQGRGVIISATDFPGWQAYYGPQKLAISRTGEGLMAVKIPSGDYSDHLILKYEPDPWKVGLYVTLAALAFALGFWIYTVLSSIRPVQRRAACGSDVVE